jgi:hypothetical protein
MKNYKLLILVTLFLSTVIFFACSKENNSDTVDVSTKFRSDFLKGKDYAKVKSDYYVLDKKEKVQLWNEKLEQLLRENLPAENRNLIMQLKLELNKEVFASKAISEIAINLAKITPEEDFFRMFSDLNDYNYGGKFKGVNRVSDDVLMDLRSINPDTQAKIMLTLKTASIPCNCDWTCSWYGSTRLKCTSTRSGCGFLWAFECDKAV